MTYSPRTPAYPPHSSSSSPLSIAHKMLVKGESVVRRHKYLVGEGASILALDPLFLKMHRSKYIVCRQDSELSESLFEKSRIPAPVTFRQLKHLLIFKTLSCRDFTGAEFEQNSGVLNTHTRKTSAVGSTVSKSSSHPAAEILRVWNSGKIGRESFEWIGR